MPKADFIAEMAPYAIAEGERLGLDPRIIIAQAAQETGWAKSAPGNNYFGIKSHGKGGGNTMRTHEYVYGEKVYIDDSFRGYAGVGDSVKGYGDFLKENPRYSKMLGAEDFAGQLKALGESGYATDQNYARSVGSIARGIDLEGYDPISESDYASLGNPGPTRERAGIGGHLDTRERPEARKPKEYADNFVGRMQQKRDGIRSNIGEKMGLNEDQMASVGSGLTRLSQQLLNGEFG